MSREAIRELQQHRANHVAAITEIDAVLRLMGQAPGRSRRTRTGGATPAQLAGLAKARAARKAKLHQANAPAPKPRLRVRTAAQRQRNSEHPTQAVSKPASLAAAAE